MTEPISQDLIREAIQHHGAGRLGTAETLYRRILEQNPEDAEALHWLGVVALQCGKASIAIDLTRRSLKFAPGNAQSHSDMGNALVTAGQISEGETAYRQAIELDPANASAWSNLGIALKIQGQLEEAEQALREALKLEPGLVDALSNLGGVLVERDKSDEALEICRAALEIKPDLASSLANLSAALKDLDRLEEAIEAAEKAVQIDPLLVQGHLNLGSAHQLAGELESAESAYQKALELKPDYAEVHFGLGNVRIGWSDLAGAQAAFERAMEIQPGYHDAHLALASVHLTEGDLSGFWSVYAQRWKSKNNKSFRRFFPQAKWQGEALAGKRILIWGEQGIGDEILFAGLIPEVAAMAESCVVETEPRLVPLFARSFPSVQVLERTQEAHPATHAPGIDLQAPMGDLPRWLRPSFTGFKPLGGYLIPDEGKQQACRARYDALGEGAKVGISWHSRLGKRIPLEHWAPILNVPGACFISLQYGDRREELAAAFSAFGVPIHHDPQIDPLTDMDGFAAQTAAMDAVVTIDNSTLSVAAGLAKPTFAMIPKMADWRYTEWNGANPWHHTLYQFRQEIPGQWGKVIDDTAAGLREFLKARRP